MLYSSLDLNTDSRFCLAALRSVWGTAASRPTSLRDALQAKSDTQFSIVAAGGIKSTSANGQHTIFSEKNGQGPIPAEVLAVWVYLVELFDRATGELGGTPTDTLVEAKMETYLRPVTGYTDNWMYLAK